jgi:hypothetical protein
VSAWERWRIGTFSSSSLDGSKEKHSRRGGGEPFAYFVEVDEEEDG